MTSDTAASADPPAVVLDRLEQTAQRVETPCGDATMVWHIWGSGPPLVLLHGGAGSWRHWVRNIGFFARHYRVVVADLPGLGESAMPPEPITPASVAAVIAHGIDAILGPEVSYDLVGFSFGGVMGAEIALASPARLRSLTIVGSGGLDLPRNKIEFVSVRSLTGDARKAATATNLSRLMIADATKIDDLALEVQEWNAAHSRLNTPKISTLNSLHAALGKLHVKLNAIYGECDAIARPRVADRAALFRGLQPGVDFRIIPGAGHWLPYETPREFNTMLLDMLQR